MIIRFVTHDQYQDICSRLVFAEHRYVLSNLIYPYTIEADSDTFFQAMERSRNRRQTYSVAMLTLGGALSFCYIDGNHTYEFAKSATFENTDRFLVPGGFILFDDSGDGSGWEVCKVVDEVLKSGSYHLIAKNPNYLVQKS